MGSGWTDRQLGCIQCNSSTTIVTTSVQIVNERSPLITTSRPPLVDIEQHYDRGLTCINVIFVCVLSVCLTVGVAIASYLLISEGNDWITWKTYSVIHRIEWKAIPPKENLVNYKSPISRVILVETNTDFCWKEWDCCKIVKSIQDYHMTKLSSVDILYNFLIGSDGQIYEGTGWKTKINNQNPYNYQNSTITLALIGRFFNRPISKLQADTAKTFLEMSVSRNLLNECHTILVPYSPVKKQPYLIDFAADLQTFSLPYCEDKSSLS